MDRYVTNVEGKGLTSLFLKCSLGGAVVYHILLERNHTLLQNRTVDCGQ